METARTLLRRLEPGDYETLRTLEADPAVMRFTSLGRAASPEESRTRLAAQIEAQAARDPFGIWLAEEKNDFSLVGWFMLLPREPGSWELGFMLPGSKWDQGFATEIGWALVAHARKHGAERLEAKTTADNEASQHVLRKLGFRETPSSDSAKYFSLFFI